MARTVLIVDDSPIAQRTVCSALQSDGFAACGEANDGKEAMDLAEKLSPDRIILESIHACDERPAGCSVLRKLVPKSPIVLYTLHAGGAVKQQLETIEVDSVLSKNEPLSRLTEEAHSLLGE